MERTSKRRVITYLSLILLTAFLSISLLNYLTTRNSLEEEIVQASMPLLRENIYSTIFQDLLPSINTASLMANDSFLVDWARSGELELDSITEFLGRIVEEYGFITAFFVSDGSLRYYHPPGILKDIAPGDEHDIWYFQFIDSGKAFDLDVDTNEAANDILTIFVNFRLEDQEGRLLGVTGVGMEMLGFSGFLSEQQELYDRRIFLVDEEGITQAHSNMSLIENMDIRRDEGIRDIADEILVKSDAPFSGRYGGIGNRTIVTSRYIPEIDWFLIVEHDEKDILATARSNLAKSLIIGLIAFGMVLGLSLLTINDYDSQMQALVITDALTGIANRRALEAALPRMIYRRRRVSGGLVLLMIDFDGFKALNDSRGHQAGDDAILAFTRCAASVIRADDLLVRWGGDEFIIVTESGGDEAMAIAERLRSAFGGIEKDLTLSIGLAEASEDDEPGTLVRKADIALYEAKENGRDRTCRYSGGSV